MFFSGGNHCSDGCPDDCVSWNAGVDIAPARGIRARRRNGGRMRCLVLILYFIVSAGAQSATQREIRVVMDDNYPPFAFRDSDGRLQGILIDEWQLWERQTGVKVRISAVNWNEALRLMRAGEADVIDTIFRTDERTIWLDFTAPYASNEVPIFFDRSISGIVDLASLKGFPVAAKTGDAAVGLLQKNGVTTLQLYDNYESIVNAAKDHKVNVFVIDQLPAQYFLNKQGIGSRFRQSAPIDVGQFRRAVRKGNSDLLSLVERGFAKIDAAQIERIKEKWYGAGNPGFPYLRYIGVASVLVLMLVSVLLVWNRALRRAVARHTAALKRSETRLRAILQAQPDGVQIIDTGGRLLYMNPAGLAMLQAHSLHELQEQSLGSHVLPEYREAFRSLSEKVFDGENATLEFEVEGLQGVRRWLAAHVTPLRGETDEPASLLAMTQDITERKRAEALKTGQLRVLEMIAGDEPVEKTLDVLLRVIEAQSADMLCSVLMVNAGRLRHCAAPSLPQEFIDAIDGELIGPDVGSCGTAAFRCEPVFVADIASDPLWRNYRAEALRHGLRACWSTPIVGPQNEVVGTFAIYYRIPGLPDDAQLQLIKSATDTVAICINRYRFEQALRESEERFRQVVENIEAMYWMTDADKTEVLYVSPGFEKIWGRSRGDLNSLQNDWMMSIHPDDRARMQDSREKQSLGEYHEEYRIVRPDGGVRLIRDSAFPIRDAQGKVYRIAGFAEDITERRALEEQYRQSQKMEAIGTLAAGVAHDFNNILSAITGNVELALHDVDDGHPVRENLKEIFKAGRRARDLVQQILAFTRLQQPQCSVINLGPLVEETVGFLRVTVPANVDVSVGLDAAPQVMVNSTQIQQVLLNVCANACNAFEGEPGVIAIQLQATAVDVELVRRHAELKVGRYACLSVRDNGKGMDEGTRKRIFEPFFTTRQQGQGTGLGLSVAHGIMRAHGGAIVVNSVVNAGTVVQLYFPAVAEAPAEVPLSLPQPLSQSLSQGALSRGGGQHIMYIDDEEALVELTVQILERLGYTATGFSHAHEAVNAFLADPGGFDLVVTDFNMPGTSGLDVAAQLLAIRPDLSVVLTSGYIDDELVSRAAQAGLRHVLYKPSTIPEFAAALEEVLQKSVTGDSRSEQSTGSTG